MEKNSQAGLKVAGGPQIAQHITRGSNKECNRLGFKVVLHCIALHCNHNNRPVVCRGIKLCQANHARDAFASAFGFLRVLWNNHKTMDMTRRKQGSGHRHTRSASRSASHERPRPRHLAERLSQSQSRSMQTRSQSQSKQQPRSHALGPKKEHKNAKSAPKSTVTQSSLAGKDASKKKPSATLYSRPSAHTHKPLPKVHHKQVLVQAVQSTSPKSKSKSKPKPTPSSGTSARSQSFLRLTPHSRQKALFHGSPDDMVQFAVTRTLRESAFDRIRQAANTTQQAWRYVPSKK